MTLSLRPSILSSNCKEKLRGCQHYPLPGWQPTAAEPLIAPFSRCLSCSPSPRDGCKLCLLTPVTHPSFDTETSIFSSLSLNRHCYHTIFQIVFNINPSSAGAIIIAPIKV
jgi:hypothetical protein